MTQQQQEESDVPSTHSPSASSSKQLPTVLIVGAGLIGSYTAAHLAARPDLCTTHLIARGNTATALKQLDSISATSGAGATATAKLSDLHLHESIAEFAARPTTTAGAASAPPPDYVIVAVKRGVAPTVYRELATTGWVDKPALLPFMNGIRAADEAADFAGALTITDAMWPFNVIQHGGVGHYVQASGGNVCVADSKAGRAFAVLLSAAGVPTDTSPDMDGIRYGKLLLNLHNAVSALTGLPIQEELSTRAARKIWASCITETLEVYRANGINPVSFLPYGIAYSYLPTILSLPTFLFARVARGMLAIDPRATSSMYEDLVHNRPTEIDFIQGAIVALAKECGLQVPVCERVVALVKEAEKKKKGTPRLAAENILDALELI
ncbi:hypothetical protein HDU87_007459 [Geranomyces variabilis]|uniref:2-dehydropantoate 2-reductase n=1 Tax=Geranomyces variabilis TaxID=109894 RepID=A0AAD5XUT6_9FUNG|nr:hypothetical protein HDU87_007459 [Geranomyces variabilis]